MQTFARRAIAMQAPSRGSKDVNQFADRTFGKLCFLYVSAHSPRIFFRGIRNHKIFVPRRSPAISRETRRRIPVEGWAVRGRGTRQRFEENGLEEHLSAYAALWLFISLLIGAFCASLAATYGGRRRDF